MACCCTIAAHENEFNRAVTHDEADYFANAPAVTHIIENPFADAETERRKAANYEKIKTIYRHDKIITQYESMMLAAIATKR
jgi:hypothetical protein